MPKMRSVKVSIIIPCWGEYEKYLAECMKSIESQTFKNYEVIVVDTETDLPTARNVGVEKAKGEYIICLDVDDRLKETALAELVDKGDIVAFHREDTDGNIYGLEEDLSLENFLTGNRMIACSMFKKEVWEKIGGYDESMKDGYEDWDFWVRALRAGYKVTPIHQVLYIQRFHDDSMINSTLEKHDELKNYLLSK